MTFSGQSWEFHWRNEQTNNNNNNSYVGLYPVNIYDLAGLYIINIKIHLTIKRLPSDCDYPDDVEIVLDVIHQQY